MNGVLNKEVAVYKVEKAAYPGCAPFHPGRDYPEYPYGKIDGSGAINPAYDAVRGCFEMIGLDADRAGTAAWNPLGAIIRPGDRVLIKPNWVLHAHLSDGDYASVVTHASIIRAILDYATIALGGRGSILIADAPLWDADFDAILRRTGIETVAAFARSRGAPVEIMDMRRMSVVQENGLVVSRRYRPEQARAGRIVDLGDRSAFAAVEHLMGRVVGSDYDRGPTRGHHRRGRHEYCVSRHVLEADVILNVPKLKTHKKCGVTLSMKNLVGINVDKNFLPHYRLGMPDAGGDEYPQRTGWTQHPRQRLIRAAIDTLLVRGERWAVPVLKRVMAALPATGNGHHYAAAYDRTTHPGHNQKMIERVYSCLLGSPVRAGNWGGNDTTWRMVHDLNTIALYYDRDCCHHERPVRRYFTVIDGIIGGAGDGPMNPAPMREGVVVAGYNPLSVDWTASRLMGFDPWRLRVLAAARGRGRHPLGPDVEPVVMTNHPAWSCGIDPEASLKFEPHPLWDEIRAWQRGMEEVGRG